MEQGFDHPHPELEAPGIIQQAVFPGPLTHPGQIQELLSLEVAIVYDFCPEVAVVWSADSWEREADVSVPSFYSQLHE